MRRAVIPILLVSLVLAPGCVRLAGPDNVSRTLSREAGVDLQQEIGVTVTRSGIWLAKKTLKWANEEDIPSLDGLRRVEVGVYTVNGERDDASGLDIEVFPTDWHPWVQVHDEGSDVFVMVQHDRNAEEISGMIVVVAESEEWVVVRMHGDLDRILEDSMRFAFDQVERPDLYEKTREERDLPPLGDVVEEEDLAEGIAEAVVD